MHFKRNIVRKTSHPPHDPLKYPTVWGAGAYFFSFFPRGSVPVVARKPLKSYGFHWSKGGLSPFSPPEYTSDRKHALEKMSRHQKKG